MMGLFAVFVSGAIFALGLGLSGMTDANKVIGFLNLAGDWDPSLAFVLAGAIGVHIMLYRLILRRRSPLFAQRFQIPTRRDIDRRLLGGASLFGIGWGLGGFCPGPGIVSILSFGTEAIVFAGAMLGGMGLFQWADRPRRDTQKEWVASC